MRLYIRIGQGLARSLIHMELGRERHLLNSAHHAVIRYDTYHALERPEKGKYKLFRLKKI